MEPNGVVESNGGSRGPSAARVSASLEGFPKDLSFRPEPIAGGRLAGFRLREIPSTKGDGSSVGSKRILATAMVSVPVRACFRAASPHQSNGVGYGHSFDERQVRERHERRPVDACSAMNVGPMAVSKEPAKLSHGVAQSLPLVFRIEVTDRGVEEEEPPIRCVLLQRVVVDAESSPTIVRLD